MGIISVLATSSSINSTLWTQLGDVFSQMLTWVGSVLTELLSGGMAALLPFLAIPIAFTVIGFAIGLVKRVIQ